MLRTRWERWGAWAGIVFAILFVGAVVLVGDMPDADAPEAEYADFLDDDGNQTRVVMGFYLWAVGGLAFLWYLSTVYRVLNGAEGEPSTLSRFSVLTGSVFVALWLAGGAALAAVAGALQLGQLEPEQIDSVALMRVLPQLGWGVLAVGGGFMAAGHVLSSAIVSWQTGLFPRWLSGLGLLLGVVLLFSVIVIPLAALALWVLLVCIMLLTNRAMTTVRPMPA